MFEKKKQEDKGSMENMENMEGGYVFLSHSHLDIRQVRKIRNKMEEEGSEHTMKSVWQRMELEYAMTQEAVVLPIVLGDVTLNTSWKMRIGAGQCCMVDRNPTDDEIRAVVDRIEQFLLQQFG